MTGAAAIAHVVTSGFPLALQWLLAIALFGGLLAAATVRRRSVRAVAVAAAAVGLAGTVASMLTAPPVAPPYTLALRPAGGTVPEVTAATVCAVSGGATAPLTPGGDWLLYSADGTTVAETHASTHAVELSPGTHRVTVRLLDPGHHDFSPAETATATWIVTPGATQPPQLC